MTQKKFQRSSVDCLIAGICGGIAEYLEIPAWLVRVLWVIISIITVFWLGILVYVLMWIFVPKNPSTKKIDPAAIDADFEVKE